MDAVLTCKVPPVTERAFNIYCATKGTTKKAELTAALDKHIPPEFFKRADQEINGKKKGGKK